MKAKLLNLGLIVTSLFGYLEWGRGNEMFLFQIEIDLIAKLFSDPMSVLHPFTILPVLGQFMLACTLFQGKVSARLTYLGMGCIGILLLFMLVVGILAMNPKILGSTLPFLLVAFWTIRYHRRRNLA